MCRVSVYEKVVFLTVFYHSAEKRGIYSECDAVRFKNHTTHVKSNLRHLANESTLTYPTFVFS